jgi:hypothetical protein
MRLSFQALPTVTHKLGSVNVLITRLGNLEDDVEVSETYLLFEQNFAP